jgi:hypothetical protein
LVSCNDNWNKLIPNNKNISTVEQESTEEIKVFEFISREPYFNGGWGSAVNDLNIINGFEKYFKLVNNVVIRKDTSTPFTGEIILYHYYEEVKENANVKGLNNMRKLNFTDGYLSQLEFTFYNWNKVSGDYRAIYNAFHFFNEQKQMEYCFHLLESYDYITLSDDTPSNNLKKSSVSTSAIPGGLYKVTYYKKNGEIDNEGYGQWLTVPYYNTDYESDSWTQGFGKVGTWKHYLDDGLILRIGENTYEQIYEEMWVLINRRADDIKDYRFE